MGNGGIEAEDRQDAVSVEEEGSQQEVPVQPPPPPPRPQQFQPPQPQRPLQRPPPDVQDVGLRLAEGYWQGLCHECGTVRRDWREDKDPGTRGVGRKMSTTLQRVHKDSDQTCDGRTFPEVPS